MTSIVLRHSSSVSSKMSLLSEIATLLTQDIYAAEFFHGHGHHAGDVIGIGHVTHDRNGIATTCPEDGVSDVLGPFPPSMSTTATSAPCCENSFAISSPMFLPAPVMIADLPFNLPSPILPVPCFELPPIDL